MIRPEHALRRQCADISRLTWERGWVANHDGNATARASEGRIIATPTALSKRVMEPDMLLVVDGAGRVVRGQLRPFSELGLHLEVYKHRSDAHAVLHAHPPHATARAMAGRALPCFLPEAVVSLGAEIPLVPFAAPGKAAEQALVAFLAKHDAVLLEHHGVLAWGEDLEQAFLRMELVEHLSRIAHLADPTGGVRALPAPILEPLLARHRAVFSRH